MKLLVLSDSHGSVEPMVRAAAFEKPDAIVHLGDMWDDAEELQRRVPGIQVYHVAGNCDFTWGDVRIREEIRPIFDGVRMLAVHGHRYNVKSTLIQLLFAAMEQDAKVALYGHTHVADATEQNGILLLNPGTCRGCHGTYAIVDVADGRVNYRHCFVKDALEGKNDSDS